MNQAPTATIPNRVNIQNRLIDWYRIHRRSLPWRKRGDAYGIWVSEIMLQQTQVETVKPYFNRFMAAFPTVEDLAKADEQHVLSLWSGLGYYARARNLHRGAQMVVRDHGGQLPETIKGLKSIRGIGPYTAGAIASIAYHQPEALLDGNVARVYSRLFALSADPKSTPGKKHLWGVATEMVSFEDPSSFNQGLMELGALVCTPTSPDCGACPISDYCQAKAQGLQGSLPTKSPKKPRPHVDLIALIIQGNQGLLMAKRASSGLLGGLWEFPLVPVGGGEPIHPGEEPKRLTSRGHGGFPPFEGKVLGVKEAARWRLGFDVRVSETLAPVGHIFTHFSAQVFGVCCVVQGGALNPQCPSKTGGLLVDYDCMEWFEDAGVGALPMGKIAKELLKKLGRGVQ